MDVLFESRSEPPFEPSPGGTAMNCTRQCFPPIGFRSSTASITSEKSLQIPSDVGATQGGDRNTLDHLLLRIMR